MDKINATWKIFSVYMLIIILTLVAGTAFGQVKVMQFNAGWNSANDVEWVMGLKDCKTIAYIDIGKDKEAQAKYKIAVVPTIIIFKDGEEVARFQADLSFKMVATKEEVQEEINTKIIISIYITFDISNFFIICYTVYPLFFQEFFSFLLCLIEYS